MKRTDQPLRNVTDWHQSRDAGLPTLPTALLAWATEADVAVDVQSERARRELALTLSALDALNADAETLCAAIVFGCQTPTRPAPTAYLSGGIAELVAGQAEADKVWLIYAERGGGAGAEGLRRLLLAIIRDVRVVLILLARQLVRLRAASTLPEDARRQLAQLTADIHSPLANRLGIWQVKWELEDLAFRHSQPETYRRIADLLDERRADRERFIEGFKSQLRHVLQAAGVEAEVAGRPKHIYSIWKKLQRKGVPFSELYDIRAVRVLVRDIDSCYAALGVVHGLWSPVAEEFDDYIAHPKGNHYRSLHTAVIGAEGKTVEIQIRTFEMHAHAELGVAAHWRYKEGGGGDADFERKIAWMRQLLETREGDEDGSHGETHASTALIEDRIYVLTPQNAVIDLPRGGTVLDFAYHVHTEVGHRCRGAKVNGRIVPLGHQPRSGDRIEILTAKSAEPRRDWLLANNAFLASSRARDKVRAWFHRLDQARNLTAGKDLLDRELKRMSLHQLDIQLVLPKLKLQKLEELYVAVALGDVSAGQVARALHDAAQPAAETARTTAPLPTAALARPPKPAAGFTIEGVGNLLTQMARCCQPVAGDPIQGYLTQARGVSIHRRECVALQRLAATHPERLLPVEWGRGRVQSFGVDVLVRGYDRKWLLKDLTNVIGSGNAHILGLNSRVDAASGIAELRFTLKVSDFEQLDALIARLSAIAGVNEVRRWP
ncbi:MAG: bifunctional (p)ppGpp synthetase/guanosine-3',5'-bis(diphosphate) 3'-pyrophosphohydrolase [Pseudomarimonas sp.]